MNGVITHLKACDLCLHHLQLHLLDLLLCGTHERTHGVQIHAHSLLLGKSVDRAIDSGRHRLLHAIWLVPDVEVLRDHVCQLVFLLMGIDLVVVVMNGRITGHLEGSTWCGGVRNVLYCARSGTNAASTEACEKRGARVGGGSCGHGYQVGLGG